jgi:hypothetical protein
VFLAGKLFPSPRDRPADPTSRLNPCREAA